MKQRILAGLLSFAFLATPLGADSCKTSSEKIQRDSKELEEATHKMEAERGCLKEPPYTCPPEGG